MAAAPARIFSVSSVETLPLSASPAVGNGRRGHLGSSVRPSVAASKTLVPDDDMDLQDGLTNVQTILHQCQKKNGREMMVAVDNLKRLCIDHYFQEEIKSAMGACMRLVHSDDLFDATLAFRLMREAGHDVLADDILQKFTDGAGEFNPALSHNIRGLLSLHDMSQLNIGEEPSLHKAKEFSTKHLTSAIRYLEPSLARYVRQSLDHPYHLSLMQYKARHHLSYLQCLPNRSTTAMEELAIAEFKLNKQMHQIEMQEVKRWWVDLGLAHEIPVIRDQVLKWYMWAVTILRGSSFSRYRVEITKIISFVYVVDGIFDLVGTPEELSHFTDAIKVWDMASADSLPAYMRSCYKALYTVTNEIANMAEKEHGFNTINHLKKAWGTLFDGFMLEAKWLATNQVPSAEEYLRNGVVTSGVPLAFAHVLVLLGHDDAASNDAAKVISCVAKILRLYDDMGSAKDEAQEGLDGSYKDFYLMENPRCAPADAEEHMLRLIAMEWEELNRECFRRRRTFSHSFTQACLNTTRMISVMYGYNQEQRLPVKDIVGGLPAIALWNFFQLWDLATETQLLPDEEDSLIWTAVPSGTFSSRSVYECFFTGSVGFEPYKRLWKSWAPLQAKFFIWLAVQNRCWIADRLARRGLDHPACCLLFDQAPEDIDHILTSCVFTSEVWHQCMLWIGRAEQTPTLSDLSLKEWWRRASHTVPRDKRRGFNTLVILVAWETWKHRNNCLFEGARPLVPTLVQQIKEVARLWTLAGAAKLRHLLPLPGNG